MNQAISGGMDTLRRLGRRAPVLTAAEEIDLARAATAGDTRALDALVAAHVRLVLSIARQYRGYGLPVEDVVSEGLLGLVEGATRFDPDRGVRLAAYAAWWIRAYIRKYALSNRRIVRAPSSRKGRRVLSNIGRTRRELTQALGEPPNAEQLAEALDVPVRDVEEIEHVLASRDVPVGPFDDGPRVDPEARGPSPEEVVAEAEEYTRCKDALHDAMGKLDPRERRIVRDRFLRGEGRSLSNVGRDMGLSRERVRQIEADARRKLRAEVLAFVA